MGKDLDITPANLNLLGLISLSMHSQSSILRWVWFCYIDDCIFITIYKTKLPLQSLRIRAVIFFASPSLCVCVSHACLLWFALAWLPEKEMLTKKITIEKKIQFFVKFISLKYVLDGYGTRCMMCFTAFLALLVQVRVSCYLQRKNIFYEIFKWLVYSV